MEYLDEELLEARRKLERQKHTTLETGIYAKEELITFKQTELFDNTIHLPLPEQFVVMPESVKSVKYPSKDAPAFIITRACLKNAFRQMCVILCGRFGPNEGDVVGYAD